MNGASIPTGCTKLGSIIGDHARTGLGVLLNCGTMVGPFASILPTGELAPRDLPAFGRHGPDGMTFPSEIDEVLATAEVVMSRRGKALTPALREIYLDIARRMCANESTSFRGALRKPA
jgi:hypothetical protein